MEKIILSLHLYVTAAANLDIKDPQLGTPILFAPNLRPQQCKHNHQLKPSKVAPRSCKWTLVRGTRSRRWKKTPRSRDKAICSQRSSSRKALVSVSLRQRTALSCRQIPCRGCLRSIKSTIVDTLRAPTASRNTSQRQWIVLTARSFGSSRSR